MPSANPIRSHRHQWEAVAYQDPLGDVELGDMDDTGICMGYIDPDIDDPTSEVDMSGSEVNRLYN